MKSILLFSSLIFIVGLSNSCQKAKTLELITSDVRVYLYAILSPTGQTFQIQLATEDIYGCSNYTISNDFSITDNQIDLNIKGIIIPGHCLTSLGPAIDIIDIEPMAPGNYPFNITINNHLNEGELIVSPNSYAFNFLDTTGIQFPVKVVNLIPENTIWGNISYNLEDSESIANDFIDSLLSIGCEEQLYPSGNYNYFQIKPDGQIANYEYSIANYHQRYIYHFTGSSASLESLVQQYETTYPGLINISLITFKGEYF
ncbi:MAG: hypothetical protein GQ574_28965 [Crocinitomix sp.]|nr:hypothetical protein [Crocinitomix sp.]